MPHPGIHWLAIIVAALIPMVVGGLWYSNLLFAKQWLGLIGKTEEEIRSTMKSPATMYGVTFLMCLIMAYVMEYFVYYTESMTFLQGMKIGGLLCIGVAVTVGYQSVTFEFRKNGLYLMSMAYNFVSMVLMGGLLAVWR